MDEPVNVEMEPEEALRLLLGEKRREEQREPDGDEHDDDSDT
jgi:hypothetical protein